MKSVLTLSASLLMGLLLSSATHANDHKVLGVIAMPRNETNDLTLKLPVCRVVKRIQLTADHGDLQININSDNDNKRCVKKITFSGHTVNSSDMATLKIIGDD